MIDKAREVTLKILYKIDRYGAYSNIALDEEIKANNKILNVTINISIGRR